MSQQNSRYLSEFPDEYVLVTDSQEIKCILKDCLGDSKARRFYHQDSVTGMMLLIGDAERLEVWVTHWGAAYNLESVYDHIWLNENGLGTEYVCL
jgi:hypothetical protein